jgi:hypothetical protein
MQRLGALPFCERVNLVGENVVGVSPGDDIIDDKIQNPDTGITRWESPQAQS